MLEIKTIWGELVRSNQFDAEVNEALADGWELVRREVLPRRVEHSDTLIYAELERIVEEPEEVENPTDDTVGVWLLSRDPHFPFKCSACGYKTHAPSVNCPDCNRLMETEE